MNSLKFTVFKRFNQLLLLFVLMSLSIILLMVRMKIHQEFFYLFLVWNLFLAFLPFLISFYLSSTKRLTKLGFYLWGMCWMALLPNAPYIITDFIHLNNAVEGWLYLDFILILSFALNGVLLYLISVYDMFALLKAFHSRIIVKLFIPGVAFLSAFGIYLGRVLRYNSWEIIQNPFELSLDILKIIVQPRSHIEAWVYTFCFGLILYTFCLAYKSDVWKKWNGSQGIDFE